MSIDNFIKTLIQTNMLSEDDALFAVVDQLGEINLHNYDSFISLCKKYHITDEDFFMKIYLKSSEEAQYRLWKDGFVNSCPAQLLISDIVSEESEIVSHISRKYENDFIHCNAYFESIQNVIVDYISHAKESLKIAMAWFTNPVIFNALMRACKRGVDVQLLINNDNINIRPNGLPFDRLIDEDNSMVYIAEPPSLIHNKFCIIDEKIVIDGSYNWTVLAETNNDENIVVIENGNVIDSFVDAFRLLLARNNRIYEMPKYVPNRRNIDPCSYRYINSEEYLIQALGVKEKKKQRELYKEVYKLLPSEIAEKKIPSDVFEVVKNEVEKERNHDTNLFNASIISKSNELQKFLDNNVNKLDNVTRKVDSLAEKKEKEIRNYKLKVQSIQSKRISSIRKETLLADLRKTHTASLQKTNRILSKTINELNSLQTKKNDLEEQKEFVNSLQGVVLEGNNGMFRVNLQWNTEDDLDLHFLLPNGTIDSTTDIYYGHKQAEYNGGFCSLDHDAIPDNAGEHPQENIIWENKLPDGQYRVAVKLYNKKSSNSILPFSISTFVGNYKKTGLYKFVNAQGKETIHIATITFKNGKVVTPIVFNKD